MGTDYSIEGEQLVLRLNPNVYTLDMVYSTAYAYLDDYYFLFDGNPQQEIVVKVQPRKGQNLDAFAKTFMNELISITNYFTQLEKNKDVINAVLQRALFTASPQLVEDAEEEEINKLLEEVEDA